jgi:DNA-binding transcriptional LysR family regulator
MDLLAAMQMFRMVAEGHSLAEVGRQCGQAASTVSRRIQALEARLGVRLIQRTTRDVQLTAMGAEYLDRVAPILDELDATHRMLAEQQAVPRGLLRVTAPPHLAATRIAPLIRRFLEMHPGVRVELITTTQVLNFVQERIDLAIRIGALRDSILVARKLAPYRFVCCGVPQYFAARGRPRHPDDLRELNCLVSASQRSDAVWEFEKAGERFKVRVSGDVASTDPQALQRVVLQGGGVAMLPLWVVEESVATQELEVVLPAYEALQWGHRNAVYAVYPTRRHLPPKVRAFLAYLVEALPK